MFVDEVDIHVAAGHGGRGAMSFRREKFVPRGGPNGGDGGPGGSVFLVADANLNTLLNFRFQKKFEAGRGAHGEGSNRTGRDGSDIELKVPVGTMVYERVEADEPNRSSRTSRKMVSACSSPKADSAAAATRSSQPRRTARRAARNRACPAKRRISGSISSCSPTSGWWASRTPGNRRLISRISAARPKIADYPFTTLTPNLGVVGLSGDRSFVVADIPGLIEGAHAGHGLGHRFLSHLERTKVLVHLVDVSSASGRDPVQDFDVIMRELELFPGRDAAGERLIDKPMIVAANKIDALDEPDRLERLRAHLQSRGLPLYAVSAAAGQGLDELLEAVWREVAAARERATAAASLDRHAE